MLGYFQLCSAFLRPCRNAGFKALLPTPGNTSITQSRTWRSYLQHRRFEAHASNKDKQIAIVGGGMAGLTAARVLQKHGFSPVVYEGEQHQGARAQGGVLDLHPHSGQWALEQAGLLDKYLAAARPEGQDLKILDKDGSVLWEETGSTEMDRPEIDRPLLRQILLDSLTPETVCWDHHITRIEAGSDIEPHTLHFSNQESKTADVVIGAEGAWSKVRSMVTDAKPTYQNATAIEFSIPDVDDHHADVAATVGRGTLFALADNKGFVAQRQGNGDVRVYINFRMQENDFDSLGISFDNAAETQTQILANFKDWAPAVTNLIQSCDNNFRLWPCYALPVGLRWQHHATVTLLGDAAHLMSPFAGEGANTAMQDAADIALALARHGSTADAIAAYEVKMWERAHAAAEESARNLELFVSPDGSKQFAQFMQSVTGPQS